MRIAVFLAVVAGVFICGCPGEDYPTLVDPTLRDINRIRDNNDLPGPEQRTRLEELGLEPSVINALLLDERLANQFGGSLRSAYEKITGGRMDALTPDEVQFYGDEASAVSETDTLDVSIEDDEAVAIVNLFRSAQITTRDELAIYLNDANNVLPVGIPDNTLRPLFVDFDPVLVLPRIE